MIVVSNTIFVWVDSDITTTVRDMHPYEISYSDYERETEIVESFGNLLVCKAFLLNHHNSDELNRLSERQLETGSFAQYRI